eukprot:TRINITY_DN12736_c0_g1_i1.p1 TRINITY_DN12736_c0_g1~~TRINITY_DN12736_c0_g1_i1.p1  ORF type:complete len:283 (+),score=44.07 TRINITY_DN12736_c0_g1_i1:135-983(+)
MINIQSIVIFLGLIALSGADVQVGASKDATLYYNSYTCSPAQCGNTNYGSDPTLSLGNYHISQSFLLSFAFSVSPGTQITSATIGINLESAGPGWTAGSQVNINRVTGQWSESTVTANSAPAFGGQVSTLTLDSLSSGYFTADLTTEVQRAIDAGETSIDLVFQATGSVGYSTWSSKESTTGKAPYLTIKSAPVVSSQAAAASQTPTPSQESNTCGCNSCCGSQCYDPNAYVCQTNQNNGQPQLCPSGTLACGSACYNANQYSCSQTSSGWTLSPKNKRVIM